MILDRWRIIFMLTQSAIQSRSFKPGSSPDCSAAATASDVIDLMGAPMLFKRNAEIYGEDEDAEHLYKVVTGTVRTYKVLADGRRQIGAFYVPGDVFGLENGAQHAFSAEAVSDCKVLVVKRSAVVALAERDTEVARQLWAITCRELQRAQEHFLALIKTAEERVVGFLLDMAARVSNGNQFELPMSRQDIADYLGLTIETVSRTMTQLENLAAIELPTSRRVVLRNRSALSRRNG
jgi:CRP/FNR family transcriptional regulator, nitrogen fixation regulation protein